MKLWTNTIDRLAVDGVKRAIDFRYHLALLWFLSRSSFATFKLITTVWLLLTFLTLFHIDYVMTCIQLFLFLIDKHLKSIKREQTFVGASFCMLEMKREQITVRKKREKINVELIGRHRYALDSQSLWHISSSTQSVLKIKLKNFIWISRFYVADARAFRMEFLHMSGAN